MSLSKPEKIRQAIELLSSALDHSRHYNLDSASLHPAELSNSEAATTSWPQQQRFSELPHDSGRCLEKNQAPQSDSGLQPGSSNAVVSVQPGFSVSSFSGRPPEKTSHGNEGIYAYSYTVSALMHAHHPVIAKIIYA